MKLYANTKHGQAEWKWKGEGSSSAAYKSLNHQWWFPNKSDFEIVTKLDPIIKQEVKDEIWKDLEIHNAYFKDLYKQHKLNKKEKKNG